MKRREFITMLTEIAPRTVRVGVIYDPANAAQNYLPDMERASSPSIKLSAFAAHVLSALEGLNQAKLDRGGRA